MQMQRWQVITILAVILLAILNAAPNLYSPAMRDWIEHNVSFLPAHGVNLGLDLQGGSHLLLGIDTDVVIKERVADILDNTRRVLREQKLGYVDLAQTADGVTFHLRADGATTTLPDDALRALRKLDPGLDVTSSGDSVKLALSEKRIKELRDRAMDQSMEIVRRRVDESGTREPSIQREGQDRIQLQLPGEGNPDRIKALLGQTAKLSFRLVDTSLTAEQAKQQGVPATSEILPTAREPHGELLIQKRAMVTGDMLTDAQAAFDNNNRPVVSFRFDSTGARRFADTTTQNVGRLFAIVLDQKVLSAPVIREPITGGSGMISGSFTTAEAQDLALLLRAGALPAPITVLEQRTVGPGLGADSILAGERACAAGFALVFIFLVVAYGLFGIFAAGALIVNLVLLMAAVSILGASLTLPGIAGILLTVGMAVDSNVLVFERMREEMRLGRTAISAMEAGYHRAWSAIIDSNLTTLIAGALMFFFGTGPVKGFAVTLVLGIITSLFSVILVSRGILSLWYRRKRPKLLPL